MADVTVYRMGVPVRWTHDHDVLYALWKTLDKDRDTCHHGSRRERLACFNCAFLNLVILGILEYMNQTLHPVAR